jgi:hypothetical protein
VLIHVVPAGLTSEVDTRGCTQAIVGEIITHKLETDHTCRRLSLPLLPFPQIIYHFFLLTYGGPCLLTLMYKLFWL